MKIKNEGVQRAIDSWYANTTYDIIHHWDQDNTWFVVIKHYSNNIFPNEPTAYLDFVRLFPSHMMSFEYHLSLDKTVDV
jgi:hypothetical protein